MKTLRSRIRNNIVYGAIALLPIAILVYITIHLFEYMTNAIKTLSPYLGPNPYVEFGAIFIVTMGTLFCICYLVGALISTQIGAVTFGKLNTKLSEAFPVYEVVANLLGSIAGKEISYPPALITLSAPGTAVIGFVMEDEGDAFLTVFVPNTPLLSVGAIYVVERSRVQLIDGSSMGAANCIAQWGLGLKKFRGASVPPLM